MAMSDSLRNKLIAVAGGGSIVIATVFRGGKDRLEGRVYEPYVTVQSGLTQGQKEDTHLFCRVRTALWACRGMQASVRPSSSGGEGGY